MTHLRKTPRLLEFAAPTISEDPYMNFLGSKIIEVQKMNLLSKGSVKKPTNPQIDLLRCPRKLVNG